MDVVGHEAPSADSDACGSGLLRQERPVAGVVALTEEGRLPPVAALDDRLTQCRRRLIKRPLMARLARIVASDLPHRVLCPRNDAYCVPATTQVSRFGRHALRA
jgi:hypothetical protein